MATCCHRLWPCSAGAFPLTSSSSPLTPLTPLTPPLINPLTPPPQVDTLDVVKQVAGPRWTMWQWAQYWAARQQQGPLLAAEVQVPQALHAGIMTDHDDDSGDEVDSAFVRGWVVVVVVVVLCCVCQGVSGGWWWWWWCAVFVRG